MSGSTSPSPPGSTRSSPTSFEPAWNFALDGQANSAAFALEVDSLTATPPVRKPITTNDDIVGSFDNGTTYAKGSSLLTMLEGWLGARARARHAARPRAQARLERGHLG